MPALGRVQFLRSSLKYVDIQSLQCSSLWYCTLNGGCWHTLQWRHNGREGVSNHQPHNCLLYRLFRCRSKKTSKLCVTGLCAGNSPVTGQFLAQMASNAENVSIWWRPHAHVRTHTGFVDWFRYRPDSFVVTCHYPNHRWLIANWSNLIQTFLSRKSFWKCRLQNGGHFVQTSTCQKKLIRIRQWLVAEPG